MPRKLTPGSVDVGVGRRAPAPAPMTLAGVVAPGPNIGSGVFPSSVDTGLFSHVQQLAGAHSASAIAVDPGQGPLSSISVDGALEEMAGNLPYRPPMLGEMRQGSLTGVPDWGVLKLDDSDLISRGFVDAGNDPSEVYPYYWRAPAPTQDFTPTGKDPESDEVWNTGVLTPLAGVGPGLAHAGAFTRSTGEVLRTARVFARSTTNDGGSPRRQAVTVSGMVFPADRGVLALLHFPPDAVGGGTMDDLMVAFAAQALTDKCVAALLLGQGLANASCGGLAPCDVRICDGTPGGVFGIGVGEDGNWDPTSFPGQASGQYDLEELFVGISNIDGTELRPPWNDLNGDMVLGAQRPAATQVPAPGQVRLGTDSNSGLNQDYGIPILGATISAYDAAAEAAIPKYTFEGGGATKPVLGSTVYLTSTPNFFKYRLPMLADYSAEGLNWTPQGIDPYATKEKARFFDPGTANSSNFYSPTSSPASLLLAGNYGGSYVQGGATVNDATGFQGFKKDYWTWQVARYRHSFVLPRNAVTGEPLEAGSYMLVHFKTEAGFEKFVRDGIGWWHATEGYEVYGAHSLWEVGGVVQHLENDGNVVNVETSASVFAPRGQAPAYGYSSEPYHNLRSSVVLDSAGQDVGPVTAKLVEHWTQAEGGVNEGFVLISGVAYLTPMLVDTGATSFRLLDDLDVQCSADCWKAGYGTDPRPLTFNNSVPALISSFAPAMLDFGSYVGKSLSTSSFMAANIPIGADKVLNLIPALSGFVGLRHVKIPYSYCCPVGIDYNETAGPDYTDGTNTLSLTVIGNAMSVVFGDQYQPVFSQDAAPALFINRPLRHVNQNFTGAGTFLDLELDNPVGTRTGKLLWHSTWFTKNLAAWDEDERGYGNFLEISGVAPNGYAYPQLFSYYKDWHEHFLDETYRYHHYWVNVLNGGTIPAYNSADADVAMLGPGLGAWAGGPIEVPVRAGLTQGTWRDSGWLTAPFNQMDLSIFGPVARRPLQVGGFPRRNPPLSAGANGSLPSAGLLLYPKTDYTNVLPEHTTHFITIIPGQPQPDYSVCTDTHKWMRAFDLNFYHHVPSRRQMQGFSTCLIRFDGIKLEDFAYIAPGPGRLANSALAIEAKVPGLTTWMDVGRLDGGGPNKQDVLLDGAGCLVLGSFTADFIDTATKMVGCVVEIHVGPVASFFVNTGTKEGAYTGWIGGAPALTGATSLGESPLLVRVSMKETAYRYDCAYEYVGGVFGAVPKPEARPQDVRGLCGISILTEAEALVLLS